MRVVIDASIDPRLVEAFVGDEIHTVQTLFDLGWQHLKDHVLVKQLECDESQIIVIRNRSRSRGA